MTAGGCRGTGSGVTEPTRLSPLSRWKQPREPLANPAGGEGVIAATTIDERRHARPNADRLTRRRRVSSVRLPWAVGFLVFAVLAVSIPVYVGDEPARRPVPAGVLDQQRAVTHNAAQAARRSTNEGVSDLTGLAALLALHGPDETRYVDALARFSDIHQRYQSVYLLGADGKVLAAEGGRPRPDLLAQDRPFRAAEMQDAARTPDGDVVIPQYAPMRTCDEDSAETSCVVIAAVVGQLQPSALVNALGGLELGRSWLVNRHGEVLAAAAGSPLFEKLPRADLREAATRASAGEIGATSTRVRGRHELVGYAPVSGFGPAGKLGWAVVTSRPLDDAGAPNSRQRTALVAALALAVATVVVFGWLWLAFVRPLDHLEREADRVAHGDIDRPVMIDRSDEIGLVARSVERLRQALVGHDASGNGNGSADN